LIQVYYAPFKGGRRPRGRFPIQEKKHQTNREIKGDKFRVIGPDNEMIGVVSRNQALSRAEDLGFDLILIAPKAEPPVCKIMDYGKYAYEQQKKEKIQKKAQVKQQLKEIRFKWRTDTHDFNFKVKHAREFIAQGNKIKATVMFRGREMAHKEIGAELLKRFVEEMEDIAKLDNQMKFEGRNLSVIMSPDKTSKSE
jgi:translation initiation factor IF-3